ncbi:phosphoribosylglycinamide formyltransferase, partial [Spiromyces aspiralis]
MASSLPAATEAKPSRNIVVLISGSGTNLQALIDAAPSFNARITHVISSKSSAHGLHRATKAGIPTHVHSMLKYKTPNQRITLEQRQKFDMDLGDFIEKLNPDLIVLAGWMLILGKEFVHRFEGKIINLHPSLPGDI